MNMSREPSLDTKWILTWETLFNQNIIKVSKNRFANVNDLCCKISKTLHKKVHKICKPTAQNILVVLFFLQLTVIELYYCNITTIHSEGMQLSEQQKMTSITALSTSNRPVMQNNTLTLNILQVESILLNIIFCS